MSRDGQGLVKRCNIQCIKAHTQNILKTYSSILKTYSKHTQTYSKHTKAYSKHTQNILKHTQTYSKHTQNILKHTQNILKTYSNISSTSFVQNSRKKKFKFFRRFLHEISKKIKITIFRYFQIYSYFPETFTKRLFLQ